MFEAQEESDLINQVRGLADEVDAVSLPLFVLAALTTIAFAVLG